MSLSFPKRANKALIHSSLTILNKKTVERFVPSEHTCSPIVQGRIQENHTSPIPAGSKDNYSGQERRIQTLHVRDERRRGYFAQTPAFAELRRKQIMEYARSLQELPFEKAAAEWLSQRRLYIRDSTAACYGDYIKRLKAHFVAPLKNTHIGNIVEYQSKMKKLYHPASVNHDLNVLAQMMKHAGLWAPIQEHYRPLPLPELDPPKVMRESEEDKFFDFAASNVEWALAYLVAALTNNSTASGKELRMLRREAIHLDNDPPYFHVPKNMKTPQRQRSIPLNERGVMIMELLLKRAGSLGSTHPGHYLFPFRIKRNFFDPTRPASESWLKYRWKLLVDAALAAKIISFRIKPHNLRHQVITRMLDYGVPIETVRQIAGHGVDSLVTRHYHHGRMEVMARAMDAIDPGKKKPSFSTGKKGKGVTA
jgi:integrase